MLLLIRISKQSFESLTSLPTLILIFLCNTAGWQKTVHQGKCEVVQRKSEKLRRYTALASRHRNIKGTAHFNILFHFFFCRILRLFLNTAVM